MLLSKEADAISLASGLKRETQFYPEQQQSWDGREEHKRDFLTKEKEKVIFSAADTDPDQFVLIFLLVDERIRIR
jgi:hypothetical protein